MSDDTNSAEQNEIPSPEIQAEMTFQEVILERLGEISYSLGVIAQVQADELVAESETTFLNTAGELQSIAIALDQVLSTDLNAMERGKALRHLQKQIGLRVDHYRDLHDEEQERQDREGDEGDDDGQQQ